MHKVRLYLNSLALAPLLIASVGVIKPPAQDNGLEAQPTLISHSTIATGGAHSCSITNRGGVRCWGDNDYGQLGNDTKTDSLTPMAIPGLPNTIVALSAGLNHTCALTMHGAVQCWGDNSFGQLGDGTTTARFAATIVPDFGAIAIAAGGNHTCAVTGDGAVKCWGENTFGELGNNTYPAAHSTIPLDVVTLSSGAIGVAAGSHHSCALLVSGMVKCWGADDLGQLGGSKSSYTYSPVDVSALPSSASAIGAGGNHSCAIVSGATAWCWGDGSQTPSTVPGLPSDIAALSLGSGGLCGVTYSNEAVCWSLNAYSPPFWVTELGKAVVEISVGERHYCAVTSPHTVKCWGDPDSDRLGYPTMSESLTPVRVQGLSLAKTLMTAGDNHTCVLNSSGGVECWGERLGWSSEENSSPAPVGGIGAPVMTLSANGLHTCAVTVGKSVLCWGDASDSDVLMNTIVIPPTLVAGFTNNGKNVASGLGHSCATTTNGAALCWGENESGQLGDGSMTFQSAPVSVRYLSAPAMSLAAGSHYTCALLVDSSVKCWGLGYIGQLGSGSWNNQRWPTGVKGLDHGVLYIAAKHSHTCVLTDTSTVKCWGYNGFGALGDGTTITPVEPVLVKGLPDRVSDLATGDFHTCVVTAAGVVMCWGANDYGTLGDGTTEDQLLPVAAKGLPDRIMSVTAGAFHTCALSVKDEIWCWGRNDHGQLGYPNGAQPHTVNGVDVDILLPMIVH